jgi:hypothetical protein
MTRWLVRGALLAVVLPILGAKPKPDADRPIMPSNRSWPLSSDLRAPRPREVRLAIAKAAAICRAEAGAGLGTMLTMALPAFANQALLPDDVASTLACALDAPTGATCADLKHCQGGDVAAVGLPRCDGNVLRGMYRRSNTPAAVNCEAFQGCRI